MPPEELRSTATTLRDRAATEHDELPAEIAEKVQPGHALELDPPAMSAVNRWTCTSCGSAVLAYGSNVYGSAITKPCPSQETN